MGLREQTGASTADRLSTRRHLSAPAVLRHPVLAEERSRAHARFQTNPRLIYCLSPAVEGPLPLTPAAYSTYDNRLRQFLLFVCVCGMSGGQVAAPPTPQAGAATSGTFAPVLDSEKRPITAGGFVKTGPVVFKEIAEKAGLTNWRHTMGTPAEEVHPRSHRLGRRASRLR